ncbi:MAG: hypothetical protein ABW034_03780 [Steroidobacteraceae bacterium]
MANHSFSTPAPKPGEPPLKEKIVHFIVDDQGDGRPAKLTQVDTSNLPHFTYTDRPGTLAPPDRNVVAPEGFGPFGGQTFVVDVGTVNLMQTSTMPDGALPYDAAIYRIDKSGTRHLFARNLQGGFPQIKFQGKRLLLGRIGKSYSTGDFHYPDGSLHAIEFTG